ncbi:hypothetical protein BWQ96_05948 [Gracilariopsis chorda]|uniref:ASPIC/UnbV domain-containing protein n=1 Tax=Gracilariopsis chorda TaxID=448386 RepID=A0A2V3IQE0_9FLOR|nr:hypothetical protein BWQ96_05948 [Gracilariopsis chorda]|eukprot:PXF44321.1 hypothetical protein BWQ96_05948 [Gracilariopsis chorda]
MALPRRFSPLCILLLAVTPLSAAAQSINYDVLLPIYDSSPPSDKSSPKIAPPPVFKDQTKNAGIFTPARLRKYGSPAIADLDRDGFPDLLFCHHDSTHADLYFNNRDGTFVKSDWGIWSDNHGLSPFPLSAWVRGLYFTLSVGGNYGNDPQHPYMFSVDPDTRDITDVSADYGIAKKGGRGRTAIFLDLSMKKHPYWPDVIFMNAVAASGPTQFAYEHVADTKFKKRAFIGGFANDINWYATVTDIDNDQTMELVTYWQLRMWKLVQPFKFKDISDSVFPPDMKRGGVVAVAELDFDNDGDLDLYVARTKSGDLSWQPGSLFEDYLLENRDGVYYDVTDQANIPRDTTPRGVTVADFNNDGWIDIYVTQYKTSDTLLLNNGDGTFKTIKGITKSRPSNTRGDHAVAVDYDLDGRVDLVSGQGDQIDQDLGGSFRIFRNVMPLSKSTNYILIRVGNAWDHSSTPLHALVIVKAGDLTMRRRVGTPGSAVSQSYLEVQHFGLGDRAVVDVIYVKYTSGYVDMRSDVKANQLLFIGVL